MNDKTIFLGADHAGFRLKEMIQSHLKTEGYAVEDLGAHEVNPTDDYPAYAKAVADAVLEKDGLGVLLCGNAQGVCIAANKVDGIRAGVGFSVEAATTMRADDNTNIICIPGRIEIEDDAIKIVNSFLGTDFSGADRHIRRLEQVKEIEEKE